MDEKLAQALEDAIWQALDSEQGMPHSGVDPSYVIPEFVRLLTVAGYATVPILSANQCGTCQHYSWEHIGPVHPCKLCDCGRYKCADPDRQDDDLPEPD